MVEMKYNEIHTLSEVLEEGFFADKVVDLLKARKSIASNDQKTLQEILSFVKKARKGERQVVSGKLGSDALDSIGAYSRALSMIAFQSIAEGAMRADRKALEEMLKEIEGEVKNAVERKTVDPNCFRQTLDFFRFVRSQTLSEASKYYARKVEVVSWPSLLC